MRFWSALGAAQDVLTCKTLHKTDRSDALALFRWGITKRSGEAQMYPVVEENVNGWGIRAFSCGNTSVLMSSDDHTIAFGPSPTWPAERLSAEPHTLF